MGNVFLVGVKARTHTFEFLVGLNKIDFLRNVHNRPRGTLAKSFYFKSLPQLYYVNTVIHK